MNTTPLVVTYRPRESLPTIDLGWVRVRDHFAQTVGPHAGEGAPLGDLLVMADATFAPRSRFPLHRHQEMEIVSVVVSGTLSHFDEQGSLTVPEGAAQLMSARVGLVHAEGNDTDAPVRMLQIWVRPNTLGGRGEHRVVGPYRLGPQLTRVTPADLRQDASISMARLSANQTLQVSVRPGRLLYVVCIEGAGTLGSQGCRDGDGLLLSAGSGTFEAEQTLTLVVADVRTEHR